ncbi:hypothetical protein C8Q80DRAFT_1276058 [Daedaleopsis nitida]|nr:hypothetical protein C8Q80DRAFT_1276058 [Daedaleopsis nitida]
MSSEHGRETFLDAVPHDYMQRFHTQPLIDRLHFSHPSDEWRQASARCYAGGQERLHTAAEIWSGKDLHGFLEPLFAALCEYDALYTLAIDMSFSDMEPEIIELTSWDGLFQRFLHLRRLELFSRTSSAVRKHFAATFLRTCGDQRPEAESSGLTLAWVVLLRPEEYSDGQDVLLDLGALASILEGAVTRCERLELYAAKPSGDDSEGFRSLSAIPTDPDLFRTVAAPILPRLSSLVDVLTIH